MYVLENVLYIYVLNHKSMDYEYSQLVLENSEASEQLTVKGVLSLGRKLNHSFLLQ